MRLISSIKNSILASFFCALMIVAVPVNATAIKTDPACDVTFLYALKMKAWSEAQREVMTNQKMIWKPDSVLALGCYKAWLGVMGQSFTADHQSGLNGTKDLAEKYLSLSFNHGLGGGSLGLTTPPDPSKCENMDTLWMLAKCKNIDLTDFLTLNQLGGTGATDIRQFPRACSGMGTYWATAAAMMALPAYGGSYDPMSLFTSIVGTKSEAGGTCNKLVVAGSTVCTNAGCNYDNGACK